MKKISIIIPVYNAVKTLNKSIESVLRQSIGAWEIIAVDDGSTDESLTVLNSYAAKDPRILVYHQDNLGPGQARNLGMEKASGEYLAFLDSDDFWEENFLELVQQKISQSAPDVIFYDIIHEKENGALIKYSYLSDFKNLPILKLIKCQMTGKFQWGMVKVIKTSIVANNHLEFSKDAVGEEAIFSFNVLRFAQTVAFIDKPIYHYIQSNDGQHKKGNFDPWEKVVFSMKQYLLKIGQYENYKKTINSFALRSLSIACYRLAISFSWRQARVKIKQKIRSYCLDYNLNQIEKENLDKVTIVLRPFIRLKFVLPIYMAAIIKRKKEKEYA